MKFELDEATHTYTVDSRRVLHNTEVLSEAGFVNYWFCSAADREAALKRGRDVHKATELLDKKKPWQTEYKQYGGYVLAWKRFKKDFKFTPLLREVPYYDRDLDCATTLDAWGKSEYGLITVEIKTGKVEDWTAIQLSFTEKAAHALKGIPYKASTDKRWAVELRADGVYVPRQFGHLPGVTDANDIKVFAAAVTTVAWRNRHCGGANGNLHRFTALG